MPSALISLILTGNVFFVITVLSGLKVWGVHSFMQNHITSSFTTVILLLLAHSMTMFYFIGTGKKIKEVIVSLDPKKRDDYWAIVLQIKRKLFPPMTMACLATIVVFLFGGARAAGLLPTYVHALAVYMIFAYSVYVSILEIKYIVYNLGLLHQLSYDLNKQSLLPL